MSEFCKNPLESTLEEISQLFEVKVKQTLLYSVFFIYFNRKEKADPNEPKAKKAALEKERLDADVNEYKVPTKLTLRLAKTGGMKICMKADKNKESYVIDEPPMDAVSDDEGSTVTQLSDDQTEKSASQTSDEILANNFHEEKALAPGTFKNHVIFKAKMPTESDEKVEKRKQTEVTKPMKPVAKRIFDVGKNVRVKKIGK